MSKHTNRIIYFQARYGATYDEAVKMVASEHMFWQSVEDGSYWDEVDGKYLDTLDAKEAGHVQGQR